MKKRIFAFAASVASCAALLLSSCTEENGKTDESPAFPEAFDKVVAAGEEFTFDVTANLDWEISIPTSSAPYFWIQDGSQKAYAVRGKAGDAAITVGVYDVDDYESHSVEISMTMGGKTEVIGRLTLPAKENTFTLYTGKMTEDGEYIRRPSTGDFSYEYNETAVSTDDVVTLSWPASEEKYFIPVLVDANFGWTVETSSLPEWLDVDGLAGDPVGTKKEIVFSCDPAKYPMEGDKGTVTFLHENGKDKYTYNVAFPDATKEIRFIGTLIRKGSNVRFNAEGQYYSSESWFDGPLSGTIVAADGLTFYKVAKKFGYYVTSGEPVNWLDIQFDEWVSSNPDKIQSRMFFLSAQENSGEARSIELIALPGVFAKDITDPQQLINSDQDGIKDEYKDYVIATVDQEAPGADSEKFTLKLSGMLAGVDLDDITDVNPDEDPDVAQYYDQIANGATMYRLTSSNSEPVLLESDEYGSTMVNPYGCEWLYLSPESGYVTVSMTGEDGSASADKGSKAYVVFYDSSNKTVCILVCVRNF